MARKEELADKITKRGWSSLTKAEYDEYIKLNAAIPTPAVAEKPVVVKEKKEDVKL